MTGIALHLLRAIKSASGGGGLVAANHIPPPTAAPGRHTKDRQATVNSPQSK
jgi:hypothetical protein